MTFVVCIIFILLGQKTNLNNIKKYVKINLFAMYLCLLKTLKYLEFNQYHKAPFVIYPDLECIIEKTDVFKNNPENSSATIVSEHIPSRFSMSTISSFRSIEFKDDIYKDKDCMKKFFFDF